MLTRAELDQFVEEFEDEEPALVNQAPEKCIKLYGKLVKKRRLI